jgi:glucosylceramidase
MVRKLLLALLSMAGTVSARGQEKPSAVKAEEIEVKVYEASQETKGEPLMQEPVRFGSQRAPELTITVDEAVRYQTIEGFGASLTDSAAWLLARKIGVEQRREWLERLFDPEKGIGLSLLRQPMGSSDFAVEEDYTYDDVPAGSTDPQLAHFSIEKDQRYIIPVLREILTVNPKVKVIGTPWSAPAWMKTSQSLITGSLKPECYPGFASYFVKFVQSYEKAGIPIFSVTLQNEPLNEPADFPGMGMSASEQSEFLAKALGPAFQDAELKTKVLVFDHNWDLIHFPLEVLGDAKAASYSYGVATHCYGGNVSAQQELHDRFPHTNIWMTECSGGNWQKGNLLVAQTRLIVESFRNWSQAVILWNLALDQNHQPHLGGCTVCRGVITVWHDDNGAEVIPTVDYTALALASKFVRRGAVRISSNTFGPDGLEDVAFQNADGSMVLLVLNSSAKAITFNVGWRGEFAVFTLKGLAAATYVWQGVAKTR